jgi:tRNA G18 (ribose-2'-O)-methylase SpoU
METDLPSKVTWPMAILGDRTPGWVLSKSEMRVSKPSREEFLVMPRRPVTVVLDRVTGNYNIGAIFRLCDGFLAERLVICGAHVDLRKRKLVQAAQGTQHWVPWSQAQSAIAVVAAAKAMGAWVMVAERTTTSCSPNKLTPAFPACLVLGSEKHGVSQAVVDLADAVVDIPMDGMANSLNVATTAAILLHWLSVFHRPTGRTDQTRAPTHHG